MRLKKPVGECKDYARISARDAALVYHKLHQLSLTGKFAIIIVIIIIIIRTEVLFRREERKRNSESEPLVAGDANLTNMLW